MSPAALAYTLNPNHCKACNAPIPLDTRYSVAQTRRKSFCNKSCAAKLNNRKVPKRAPRPTKVAICSGCETEIFLKRRADGAGFSPRSLCDSCLAISRRKGAGLLESRTKGELFESSANWQSARSVICANARASYLSSDREKACVVCNYSNHFEVCHIKPVAEFADNATISEINALPNLVALCPNHHWELDHGLINL